MTEILDELGDDLNDDPAVQLQNDIAERLASLSAVADTPTDFEQAGGSYDASDVDFTSSSWISRLSEVQGWLHLDNELSTVNPDVFLEGLAEALGMDQAAAIDRSGETSELTVAALGQLYERADQAVRIQQIFVQAFEEDSLSRSASTKAWNDAWEDEPATSPTEPLKPVSAEAKTWYISAFIGKKLNLTPSYQRGDVWGGPARQMLIESILRGIPLPSIILLQSEDPRKPYEVVDGKQRLTAILRFVGRHPLALDKVKQADEHHRQKGALLRAFRENYPHFKKMWKQLQHEQVSSKLEDEYFFPFKLRNSDIGLNGPLENLRGKYFTQISEEVIHAADEQVLIRDLFESVPNYGIPVILYKRASQSQIHEVFNLYNKQGMHLNAEEIRNAIFHELELTKATLVAAGDSDPRTAIEDISPPLVRVWSDVEHLGSTLRSYGFGESRYRRTKVLSWIIATLLGDTGGKDLPSTARHIDDLLKRAKNNADDPLNKPQTVAELFKWVAASARIHASYGDELWSPKFKDGDAGQKWQELQLVGSLVGIAIAYIADPDLIEDKLELAADAILQASATADRGEDESIWARPKKTQTKTQWIYIARVAKAVVDLLEIDINNASSRIAQRFGSTGVESLLASLDTDNN
ncbi:DUF262 domain-containing protein [Pseudarthrobacter enclensis]|uniref:DUF262 domain-containing protein n=1 Tax=Pseudarthrobacter enclensis TaxID=993070 RepID=UPI003EE1B40F